MHLRLDRWAPEKRLQNCESNVLNGDLPDNSFCLGRGDVFATHVLVGSLHV